MSKQSQVRNALFQAKTVENARFLLSQKRRSQATNPGGAIPPESV
jgi:hypothetical protein